jgi:hypothetical protein
MQPLKSAIYAHGSEWYEISDEDIASDPSYFGYINIVGGWIIQTRTASTGAYRYAQGSKNYVANWTGRAALTYDYYYSLSLTNP